MATRLDVRFARNEGVTIDVLIKKRDGSAADITGYTGNKIRFSISKVRKGPRLTTLAIGAGITLVVLNPGKARIEFTAPLPPATTDPFKPGTYWWECEATVTGEPISRQAFGRVRIDPSNMAAAA